MLRSRQFWCPLSPGSHLRQASREVWTELSWVLWEGTLLSRGQPGSPHKAVLLQLAHEGSGRQCPCEAMSKSSPQNLQK